jgi:hypothetical protein
MDNIARVGNNVHKLLAEPLWVEDFITPAVLDLHSRIRWSIMNMHA